MHLITPKQLLLSAVIFFFVSLSLFPLVGISFFPKAEKPLFMININLPEGSSITKTEEVANYVEEVLMNKSEVINYTTNIGNGNPRIYYNVVSKMNADNYAQIFVELKEYNYDNFNNFLSDLRNEFKDFSGAKIEVKDFEQGPPVEAPIAIKILGDDISILRKISLDVENIFNNTIGTVNINNPLSTTKTDLYVNINKEKAAIYGVPIFEIDRTVRAAINGLTVSTYRDNTGKEYNIILRAPKINSEDFEKFDRIYVSSVNGAQIPLKQLAKIEFKTSPLTINHFDLARTVSLTSDVLSGNSVNTVTNEIVEKLKTYAFPKGYSFYVGGEIESQQQSFGGMAKAMIIAIVGIFGILVLQFRSYKQPLIVFSAIPLAIIGSIIALLITGNSFSFTAFVGLTSLVGNCC